MLASRLADCRAAQLVPRAGLSPFTSGPTNLSRRNVRAKRITAGLVAVVWVGSIASVAPAGAASGEPDVSLRRTNADVLVPKYGKRPGVLQVPVYVQSKDAPFDLRVRRASYKDPVVLYQVKHTSTGEEWVELGSDYLAGWSGLRDFTRIKVRDSEGHVAYWKRRNFCPNNWDRQRIDDSGPSRPVFPDSCFGRDRSFLRGMTWGIEQSWGVPITSDIRLDVPPGSYSASVRIRPEFRELFGISNVEAVAKFTFTVEKMKVDEEDGHFTGGAGGPESDAGGSSLAGATSGLPDLQALPAFHIGVVNEGGTSRIEFAANVWNAGPSPLIVEGFRRSDEEVMDAYQYFYEGNQVVGKELVGRMEYHRRDGHFHWHFLQFARYRLRSVESDTVVRSKKQAFCIVPTDSIDLSLSTASWDTEGESLRTACGGAGALWIREVLPVGWGDTYSQVSGQAINVTNVPNGEYWLEVEANPAGRLYEADIQNNVVRRKVFLRGTRGERRITVRNWQGIDF